MATALSKDARKKFNTQHTEMEKSVKNMNTYLTKVETDLKATVAVAFATQYTKGEIACRNIQKIIGILKSSQTDLTKLITASKTFYAQQEKADTAVSVATSGAIVPESAPISDPGPVAPPPIINKK